MMQPGIRHTTTARCALAALVVLGTTACTPSPTTELLLRERTVYSQAGEDGIIEYLFDLIPPSARYAVEFGAGDGVQFSNVRNLYVNRGWSGLLIEGDEQYETTLRDNYRSYPGVRTMRAWVFPGNVELLFEEALVPHDLDLLVIDIDSNDYYVWRAIRQYHPKVVLIEYNGAFTPDIKMVVDFHPMLYWSGRGVHFGASIRSLAELGKQKGYELVYANHYGVNLFFVAKEYFSRVGIADNSPTAVFRPYIYQRPVGPSELDRVMTKDFRPLPPATDLVLDEVVIQKRFRFDR